MTREPYLTFSTSGTRGTSPPIKRGTVQHRQLWPSGRGTQIGHMRSQFAPIFASLAKRLPRGTTAEIYENSDEDFQELVLFGFAKEHAVTLVCEPRHAPGIVTVIADAKGGHDNILTHLRALLPATEVVADLPETPYSGMKRLR